MKMLRLMLAIVVVWVGSLGLAFALPGPDAATTDQPAISKKDGDIIGD